MVDIDSPILVQEPFLDQSTPKPNPKHVIKPVLIFIIFLIVLSLVVALTVTILVGKKKQATSPYVSMITISDGTITHASPTIITNVSVTTIKYTSTTTVTYTSPTTMESSTTQVTIGTNSVDSTTATMITSNTNESKSNGCQLPLIPNYNRNKVVVAGGDSPGLSVNELDRPIALALDSKSNLFVVDYNNFRVMKYAPNSKKGERVLGHGTDRYPRATHIVGLFIDANDVLHTCQHAGSGGRMDYQFIIWPSSSKNGTVIFTINLLQATFTMDRNSNIYILASSHITIYYAPTYESNTGKGSSLQSFSLYQFQVGSSMFYVDPNNNLYSIDLYDSRIIKLPIDDDIPEVILEKSGKPLAFAVDCNNNLYTIDYNASLIIYNSDGDVISTMHNAIDNPMDTDSWPYTLINGQEPYIPEYFASLALDFKTGDLYVAMFGYNRVIKFSLNK